MDNVLLDTDVILDFPCDRAFFRARNTDLNSHNFLLRKY